LMLLSTTSLLSFVRADMGVTLLPALSVPLGDDLLALPVAHKGLNRRLDLITVDNVSLQPAAEALIQHITIEAEIWTSKLLQP
jgi:DNA-binding transcriptional LysR family regulator